MRKLLSAYFMRWCHHMGNVLRCAVLWKELPPCQGCSFQFADAPNFGVTKIYCTCGKVFYENQDWKDRNVVLSGYVDAVRKHK